MIFSEERISHLAHLLTDCIWKDELVDYKNDDKALKQAKRILLDYFSKDERVDVIVRERLATLKRGVYEGSREWDVLYKKYYDEEMNKLL